MSSLKKHVTLSHTLPTEVTLQKAKIQAVTHMLSDSHSKLSDVKKIK